MKIEMGESLFYSWLRHVKECQIVQTNWKPSLQWEFYNGEEIEELMQCTEHYFDTKYGYKIFKKNSSLSQFIQQGECDAVGITVQNGENEYYAVDVAFHGAGLNYGSKEETIMKVISKSIRTAMCIYGFFNSKKAEIIFASPKINNSIMIELEPCIEDVIQILKDKGYDFSVRIIANDDFNKTVLQPILLVSDGIADTSELFIRSYQMYKMFSNAKIIQSNKKRTSNIIKVNQKVDYLDENIYGELKIGKLAQIVLRELLEEGAALEYEIEMLQTQDYSKQILDLNYPLLVRSDQEYDRVRYYKQPLKIRDQEYMLCSQWYETNANNDRPYLLKWIENHSKQ